jgi:hypothetical protein
MDDQLFNRYEWVAQGIARLANYERYEGALIIGSFATGGLHAGSDLDVIVVVNTETGHCAHMSHPQVDGVPMDISFNTWAEVERQAEPIPTQGLLKRPLLYGARILFDKTGRLRRLLEGMMRAARPTLRPKSDAEAIQAELYVCYAKPGNCLKTAPHTADLLMHLKLGDVLRLHYTLHGRWWAGEKHIPEDLKEWDEPFFHLLMDFLRASPVEAKYACWQALIEHVLLALGGMDFRRMENDCDCPGCQADLGRLMALFP